MVVSQIVYRTTAIEKSKLMGMAKHGNNTSLSLSFGIYDACFNPLPNIKMSKGLLICLYIFIFDGLPS